jgi:imidazolonepropionase-like amidohydrolase
MHLPIALAAVIALQDVTIIDTINGKTLQARTVVIRDNKIAAITSAPPKDAQVVNGKGKFLIPGLWDMHMHLRGGQETLPDNAAMLKLFVANGVTSVREMGGDLGETVFTWKKEIQEGKRVGPRIFSSGPKLDGPKPSWPGSIAVSNPEDGRKAVQQVHQISMRLNCPLCRRLPLRRRNSN